MARSQIIHPDGTTTRRPGLHGVRGVQPAMIPVGEYATPDGAVQELLPLEKPSTEARLVAELEARGLVSADVHLAEAVDYVDDIEVYYGAPVDARSGWDYVINNHSRNGLVIC